MNNKYIEVLKELGFTVFGIECLYTLGELDGELKKYNIDLEGYKLYEGRDMSPCYKKFIDDGYSDTEDAYALDKYGVLTHSVISDGPGPDVRVVYYNGNEYDISGFDFPDYGYLFEGDTMWYVGQCGSDIKIKQIESDYSELVVNDTAYLGCNVEDYLAEYLIFRAKHLGENSSADKFNKTSLF